MVLRKSKSFLVLAIFIALVSASGCKDDAYTAAAKGTDDVAAGVKTGIDVTGELYADKLIDQGEKNAVGGFLLDFTALNTQFRQNVKSLHAKHATKADYVAAASAFVASGRKLLADGNLHIKNETAKARVDTFLQAIQTGLDGVNIAILNATK